MLSHYHCCAGDQIIKNKEKEKVKNYTDLKKEVKNFWNISFVAVMVIVIEALRAISKDFKFWLEKLYLKPLQQIWDIL